MITWYVYLPIKFIKGFYMVVFLTSIRHPFNSNNFERVEKLFEVTLHSVLSQTDRNFKFIIVCNTIPNVSLKDSRIIYHVVNFPAPSSEQKSTISPEACKYDKGTKLLSGILFSQKYNPDYIFIIDADDWISSRVVEYLHSKPIYPVWYVDSGYFAHFKTKKIKRKYGMTRYCGSTFVYRSDFLMKLANFKLNINELTAQKELIDATSDIFIREILGDHSINYRYFSEMGVLPKRITIPAISWVIDTGENLTGTSGDQYGIPIDQKFCNRFGLPETFVSDEKISFPLRIRETLGCVRSRIGWIRSIISNRNTF